MGFLGLFIWSDGVVLNNIPMQPQAAPLQIYPLLFPVLTMV